MPAILRETSEGTSYQIVRLCFQPYTQLGRTICTLVSLRASIRVSPDFTLFTHRSPSFGSQQLCYYSNRIIDKSRSIDRLVGRIYSKVNRTTSMYKYIFAFTTHMSLTQDTYLHKRQTPWSVFQDGVLRAFLDCYIYIR